MDNFCSFPWFFQKRHFTKSQGFLGCIRCIKTLLLSYQNKLSDNFSDSSPKGRTLWFWGGRIGQKWFSKCSSWNLRHFPSKHFQGFQFKHPPYFSSGFACTQENLPHLLKPWRSVAISCSNVVNTARLEGDRELLRTTLVIRGEVKWKSNSHIQGVFF